MIPTKDHNPSGIFPLVTYFLLLSNVVVFLTYGFDENGSATQIFDKYALVPSTFMQGEHYYTLLTSLFLHGGLSHLMGNMLFLYIFGDNLEARLGKLPFLIFYLFTGITANLVQILSDPNSWIPTIGASGAIAGIMGGYLILYPKAKIDIFIFLGGFSRFSTIPAFYMLGYWIALQIIMGIQNLDNSQGGIAYWAHAGGFVTGGVILFLIKKSSRKKNKQKR